MVRGGTDIALAFFSSSTCHIGARFDTLLSTSTIIVSPLQRTGIQLVGIDIDIDLSLSSHMSPIFIVIILVKGGQIKEMNIKYGLVDPCSCTIQYSKSLKL
jgi:hypothetical protein